ncbi:MAG: alpha/beta hydrolase [Oscillospiraceae bacterium]
MKKSSKNILIGSGIAAGAVSAAAAISHGVTKKMASIAIDRPVPKVSEKAAERVTGTGADSDFSKIRRDAANQLAAREHEIVEITAKDGVHLVGHWFCRDAAKRTIVAMHGWRSSWVDDFGIISDFWLRSGCNVLFAEQRGQNNSGGDYIGFGLLERYDCADWTFWVQEQCSLPIYLCGISMGAATVLMASALPLAENVRGIMADCGFTSPHAIWEHVAKDSLRLHYNGWRRKTVDAICNQNLNGESAYFSCEDALRVCTLPVLFVHGSDDQFVPVEMTYQNYKACSSEKRLLIVPGAGHGQSYIIEPEKYEAETQKFWSDFD